jgi:large subunit ribosomal protein L4
MAKLNVKDLEGNDVGSIDVADEVFAAEVKEHLLWEVVRWQRAKARAGTAKVKERSEVHGTHAKMFKQKGTGNARHGSRRVNVFRGGGQVHGPRPRSYEFGMNKKARSGALRSALSLRASEGNLTVIRDFAVTDAKTKHLVQALTKLDAQHALLCDDGGNVSLRRSSSNLQKVLHIAPEGLNVYDILRHPKLLISETALRLVESRLLQTGPSIMAAESEGATP